VFSKHGTKVSICIFDKKGEHRHMLKQRDGDVHYGSIKGIKAGTRYGFRVEGPWAPELGLRFDASKLLVDPFAWSLDQPFFYDEQLSVRGTDTAALVPKSVVEKILPDIARPEYRKPEFIYELPVKAFTMRHPDVPKSKRGTIAALAEPTIITHLKKIGVDTIELMPIAAWIDERHLQPLGLRNAWGYNPVQFFAVDPKLAPGGLSEIRETITELHQHGFRVILDVVLNHTGESDQWGPTLCLRGLDSPLYYAHARGELINDAGCGNTVALNDPHVVDMVIKALRHWVLKAGVDGFRFDLATVMGRMTDGFHSDAPLLRAIENDEVLSTCVMIAEPWDVGPGGYQLGKFPERWLEWNDRYRDDVRRFWRGDQYAANNFATRLSGSSDIFSKPSRSVNFLAAHDGFTLRDLLNFSAKDNLANGENNRDGKSHEVTCMGSNAPAMLASLIFSRGTIMLTAGDEFGRTQNGNNNAYAQDNEVTWLDWIKKDDALISEVAALVSLRKKIKSFKDDIFLEPMASFWFGKNGTALDWSSPSNQFVGLVLDASDGRFIIAANSSNENIPNLMPAKRGYNWLSMYQTKSGSGFAAQSVSVLCEQKL
jgi:glycogen debranching enzyme